MSPQTSYFWKNPHLWAPGFSKLPPSSALEVTRSKPSYPVFLFVSVTQETQESQLVLIIWTISSYGTAEPISLTFSVSETLSSTVVLHQPKCLSPQRLLGMFHEVFALTDIQLSPEDTASLKTSYVVAIILAPLGLEVGGVRPLCFPSPGKPQLLKLMPWLSHLLLFIVIIYRSLPHLSQPHSLKLLFLGLCNTLWN